MTPDLSPVKDIFSNMPLSKIIVMIVMIIAGLIAIKYLMKGINNLLLRSRLDKSIVQLICTVVRILLWILMIFIVTGTMGINMNSVIALLSVMALAVTLAVQGILSNVAGGAQVISSHPFTVGDYVQIGDKYGTVENIGLVYTLLLTVDNCEVHIPNSKTVASEIINYTARDLRRLDVKIGLSYETSPAEARAALMELIRNTPGILEDPAPAVYVNEYQDSSICYLMRVWIHAKDYWDVNFALNEGIWETVKKAGISIPFPQTDVHFDPPAEHREA